MSELTLRPFVKADWKWMEKRTDQLDPRGVNSPGVYTYVCEEKGEPVGVAMGQADLSAVTAKFASPRTCRLTYIRSYLEGRWDVYLALNERMNQVGIDTGHTYSEALVPEAGQCTNVMSTPDLTTRLHDDFGLKWKGQGKDMTSLATAAWRTEPIVLAELGPKLVKALDEMDCVRTWKDA